VVAELRVEHDRWTHRLSLAVRFVPHFAPYTPAERPPVRERLEVGLDGRPERPVPGPSGSPRQTDGTYRFVDLGEDSVRPTVASPSRRWITLEPLPLVTVPATPPLLVVELWPTTSASFAPGTTVIRGVLEGADVAGLLVTFEWALGVLPLRTRSDAYGEFVYILPSELVTGIEPVPAMTLPLTLHLDRGRVASVPVVSVRLGRETNARFAVSPP